MLWRIAGIGRVQFDRREEHERAAANAERRIGIAITDRQQPLRAGAERQGADRLRSRWWRGDRGIGVDRQRHRHGGAGPMRRHQRIDFGRHIADRHRKRWRRQDGAGPGSGLGRIDLRCRRLCRRLRSQRLHRRGLGRRAELGRRKRIEGGLRHAHAGTRRRRRFGLHRLLFALRRIAGIKAGIAGAEPCRTAINRRCADARRRRELVRGGRLVLRQVARTAKPRRLRRIALQRRLQQRGVGIGNGGRQHAAAA